MKHALRKYITPCGSALFMVVSTMAALIVLVTAMYMSVLSSRQVQYATFDQEQAYVSSTTMADAVVAMITNASANSSNASQKAAADLVDKIANTKTFAVGQSVNANVGDLTESSGGLLDNMDITITRMEDEKINDTVWHIYDVAITTEKNGFSETTHTFMRTKDGESKKAGAITNFFTATGYLPNDVQISTGEYYSPLFFDTEYTRIGRIDGKRTDGGDAYVNSGLKINAPVTCAGSLTLDHDNSEDVVTKAPEFWVIGNDLTIEDRPNHFNLGGSGSIETSEDRGRILVGGDFDCTKSVGIGIGEKNNPTDLYVLGNCTLGATSSQAISIYGNLFIIDSSMKSYWSNFYGKIYLSPTSKIIAGDGVNKNTLAFNNLYVTYDESGNWVKGTASASSSDNQIIIWDSDGKNIPDNAYTPSAVSKKIDEKIGESVYPKWEIEPKGGVVDINFCGYYTNRMKDQYNGFSDTVKNDIAKSLGGRSKAEEAYEPRFVYTIDTSCTIRHIYNYGEDYGVPTIVFDTGDAGNTLVINLEANRASKDGGVEDSFSWRPIKRKPSVDENNKFTWEEKFERMSSSGQINVITIGDGNLVINVGEYKYTDDNGVESNRSVIYESTQQDFFGHYGWFALFGGSYSPQGKESTTNGVTTNIPVFNRGTWGGSSDVSTVKKHIHYSDSCSGCTYVEKKVMEKDDGGKDVEKIYYECTAHGGLVSSKPEDGECYCDGRIIKSDFTGSKYEYLGDVQQPNVNIFLVSSSESADIRFSNVNDTVPMNNIFFGYVYAPYMTYMDTASGGGLKSVGGLIVSDYIMAGNYTYVFAVPDQQISDIAGDGMSLDGYFVPAGNREWRIHGV